MAAVVQQSSVAAALAKKVGARLIQANEEHKDDPVDLGNQPLPAGIRDGAAQLNKAYFSTKKEGTHKGEFFFRASAVCKAPTMHDGKRVAGRTTSVMVNLHDEPAVGQRDARSFNDNWGVFLNYMKMFGITPIAEKNDFLKILQYYEAVFKQLEKDKPIIAFSTREYTAKPTALKPNPKPTVIENWHGLSDWKETGDPVADGMSPPTDVAAPSSNGVGTEMTAAPFEEPPQAHHEEPASEQSLEDELTVLVDTVNGDPKNETDDGKAARIRLEELAVAAGATADQVQNAPDWETVAGMAMGNLPEAEAPPVTPSTGEKYNFRKRDSKGEPLADKQGKPFDPFEIELLTVDVTTGTCTAKTTKDGKPMVGINKKPIQIKFEWLE